MANSEPNDGIFRGGDVGGSFPTAKQAKLPDMQPNKGLGGDRRGGSFPTASHAMPDVQPNSPTPMIGSSRQRI